MIKKIFSKWYVYILVAAFVSVSFCLSVSYKTNPKSTEKINFFIGTIEAKSSALTSDITNKKSQAIKQVNSTFCQINSSNFEYIFSTVRSEMDFFILPISYVSENSTYIKYFLEIKTDYVESLIGYKCSYWSYEDVNKGLKIYDKESGNGICKNYLTYVNESFVDDYCIFFNYKSQNAGKLNDSSTENVFDIIKIMMSL